MLSSIFSSSLVEIAGSILGVSPFLGDNSGYLGDYSTDLGCSLILFNIYVY
jgi:hypothetical protein